MRKSVIATVPETASPLQQNWLDLNATASVEVTSEDDSHPVEAALLPQESDGWRAAGAGIQTVRLVFDKPQTLKRIWLVFEETKIKRTQEFVVRWSADGANPFRDIFRQQWNFSPPDTVRETEDHAVELSNVKALELVIVPEISGGDARASLRMLRLA
jgi:hypothetical protein